MNQEDCLRELWNNYNVYYWTKDKLSVHQVRVGSNSEAHLILTYNPTSDSCTVERTVFREYNESSALTPWTFTNGMPEHRIVKDIIDMISSKLTTQEMKDRNTISYYYLVDFSTQFINKNFDF